MNNKKWFGRAAFLGILSFVAGVSSAETVLFEDQFEGPDLSSEWISVLPSQWIQDGWLYSQSTGSPRNSAVITHDGDKAWTDYTIIARVDGLLSMGGLVENASVFFRANGLSPSAGCCAMSGDHYILEIGGPQWDLGPKIALIRVRGTDYELLHRVDGVPQTSDPWEVKISVVGPRILLWIDGEQIFDIVDPTPLLHGGVGLGVVWEARARFDYIKVTGEGGSAGYSGIANLPDINNAGGPELAALQVHSDDAATVIIKDSETKRHVGRMHFQSPGNAPIGIAGVTLGADPAIAVLFRKPNGQGLVQIRNALTHEWIHQILFFGKDWVVKAITAEDADMDGFSEISVLADRDDGKNGAVQIKDVGTKQLLKWIWMPLE
ncbi:MAG: DUF1080 domain-containing protein [Chromatiaceae bacterium]|nr:DUF1080 domain-containing protein [Chromatiaceae bacterium]